MHWGGILVTRCTPVNRDKSHHLHTSPSAKPTLTTSAAGSHTGASPSPAGLVSLCSQSWGGCWQGQHCWGNVEESTQELQHLALGGEAKPLHANSIFIFPLNTAITILKGPENVIKWSSRTYSIQPISSAAEDFLCHIAPTGTRTGWGLTPQRSFALHSNPHWL